MTDSECPDRETLRSLISVRLSSEESERVAVHVETCDACQAVIETLSVESEQAVELASEQPDEVSPKPLLSGASTFLVPASDDDDSLLIRNLVEKLQQLPAETQDERGNSPSSTSPSSARYRSGERFGRFELLECIGTGSFGSVWKARDPELDRMVAIKLQHSAGHDDGVDNFIHEARAASRLVHPGVVRVYEVGERNGAVYIVSELVEGKSLQQVLIEGRPDYRRAAELVMEIARAVAVAHDEGVVHRDLKPANVMITADDRPMILDFGLASRSTEQTISQPGMILGTPAYMSPEQARLEPHLAGRPADVYSVGVILFEMLTGERPFRGDPRVLLEKIANDAAPEARTLTHRLPLDLNTVCQKCLEKEPQLRYPTAGELADDLQRFLKNEPIRARPISLAGRVWRWSLRQPKLAAALATLVLVIIASVSGLTAFALSERSARKLSDTRLGTANDAVLDMTSIGFELRDLPGGVQSSQQLLDRVIQLSERIAETQDASDPQQQIRVARLLLNLSEIHRQLSDFEQAQSTATRSAECLEPLILIPGVSVEASIELAAARSLDALIVGNLKQHEAAIGKYDESLDLLAHRLKIPDSLHERKIDVEATAMFGRAMSLFAVGRFDDSEKMLKAAATAWQSLSSQEIQPAENNDEDDASFRYALREATTHRILARLCVKTGRLGEADKHATKAISIIARHRNAAPDSLELHENFASALLDRATVERAGGRVADELATITECVEEFQTLPGLASNPQVMLKLALAQISKAQLLHRAARFNDALMAAGEADDLANALLLFAPESLDHQLAFAQVADIHAVLLTDMGAVEEAYDWCSSANRIFQATATASPDDILHQELLAINCSHSGRLLATLGDPTQATLMFDHADDLLQDLSESTGHRTHYYSSLKAAVQENRAWMLLEAGQLDDAQQAFSTAIENRQTVRKSASELHDNTRRLLALLTLCPIPELRDATEAESLADACYELGRLQETSLSLPILAWFRAARFEDCQRALDERALRQEEKTGPDDFVRVLLAARSSAPELRQFAPDTFANAMNWLGSEAPHHRIFTMLAAEAEQAVQTFPDVPKDSGQSDSGTINP